MPMNQRTLDYVRDYKQRNSWTQGENDDDIMGYLSSKGDHQFPEGVSYEVPKEEVVEQEMPKENDSLTFLGELLDYTVDETSSDFWKESYNRSLTSEVGKALLGKEKYDTGKYAENMNVVEDIGATVVSFMYPADVIAMKLGGMFGAKAVGGILAKAAPNLAKTGGLLSAQTLVGAGGQAGGLATYEGAIGGLTAYNQGASTEEILKATGEGVIHGGVLGAITGAVGQGMAQKQAELLKTGLWSKAQKAKKGVGKTLSVGEERFINLTFGVPGQIAAESGVFTGSETLDKVNAGEDVDAAEVLTSFAKNVGLFGVLKAKSKLWGDTTKTLDDIYNKGEKALEKEIIKRQENVEGELKKEHSDADIESLKKPLQEEIKKVKDRVNEADGILKETIANNKHVEKLFTKPESEMTGKDYGNLLVGVLNNIGILSAESKGLKEKIENSSDGIGKDALKNSKKLIDDQLKEWLEVSEEYRVKAGSGKGQAKELDIVKETDEGMIDYLADKGIESVTRTIDGKRSKIPVMEATSEELSRRVDTIRESEKKVVTSTAEETVTLMEERQGQVDPIKAFTSAFTEANVSLSEAKTGQGKGFAKLVRKETDGHTLTEDTQKKIIMGIKESFPLSKGTKTHVEAVIKYAQWLEQNGFKFGKDHGKREIVRYLEETGQWESRNRVGAKLTKFFGTVHGEGKLNIASGLGFSGKFMKKNIGVLDFKWKEVEPGKAMRIEPSDKKIIDNVLNKITDKDIIDIGKAQKGDSSKETTSTIIDLLYKFPKRIATVLRLKAGDVNTKTGEVSFFITKQRNSEVYKEFNGGKEILDSQGKIITGKTQKINIAKTNPELFKKLKALSEGKEVGDFLFTTTEGNVLRQASVNNIIKEVLKRGGVNPKSIRGGDKFTAHNFRHSVVVDAEAIFRETGRDYRKLTEDVILAHGDKSGSYKHYIDTEAGRKDIATELLQFNKDRKKIKKITDEDSNRAEEILKSKQEGKESEQVKEEIVTETTKPTPTKPKTTPEIVKLEKQLAKQKEYQNKDKKLEKEFRAQGREGEAQNKGKDVYERERKEIIPLKEKIRKLKEGDYQLEKDVKLDTAPIKELERQIEYFSKIPAYKNLQIKLHKTLGKFRGEQVLGRIRGHAIDIAQGKAKMDTIPHEISHHAVDILTAVGTNKSKALIRDGKRMFGSEEKLVQALGEYTSGRMTNRSMISRTKAFVSRMMSEVRNFFGVAKEIDVVRILSEKVLKGKLDTRNPQEILKADAVKFQTNKKEVKIIKDNYNREIRKMEDALESAGMTSREKAEMRKDFISSSYIGKDGRRTYKVADVSIAQFELYKEYLTKRLDGTKGFGIRINDVNMEYQITKSQQKSILEAMGIRDGNINNIATSAIVKRYEAFVREAGTKTNPIDGTDMSIGRLKDVNLPRMRGVMPVYYVLDTYGGKAGKKIAQKIIDFDFIHNYKIKGQGDHHAHNIHMHLKRAKQADNFWMLDAEMVKKVKTERELTTSEKSFLKDKDIRDSDVYNARKHYEKMTKFMWQSLMDAAKKHHNPIEYEAFEKRMSEKFVEEYMTRRVTKEALEGIRDGEHLEKMADKMLGEFIIKEANKYASKSGHESGSAKYLEVYSKEKARIEGSQKEKEVIMEAVKEDLLHIFEHKHYKVKNGYLMERVPVLPEFIEVLDKNGRAKKVKTYSTNAESIVDPYISGMSKYIATVDVFPEYTNIGGKFSMGTKKATLELEMADSQFAQYAKKGIRRIIGLEQQDAFQSQMGRVGQKIASTSAAFGLSSPLSGLKNIVIGLPRSVASFGFNNTVKGLRLAFSVEGREAARKKGALEYGAKHLELAEQTVGIGKAQVSLEKVFKWNAMTLTENINRIASMEAGRLHFIEQHNNLRGKRGLLGTTMKEGQVRDMMKDMWRLNNKQIDFLKEANLSKPENRKKLEGIMQVAEHYSHVSAQGGTGVGSLPLWMSHQGVKPFLLFQRFATAITWDTHRNYVMPAIKHGNFAPLITAAAGAHLGGALLYKVYEELFSTEPPKEATSVLEKGIMYLHRAEFLGMFGELISPYDKREGIPFMEPVIYRNSMEAMKNIYAWWTGGKSYEQALKDMTRRTVVVAAQAEKFYDNIVHPDFTDSKQLHTMAREFKSQNGIVNPNINAGTGRSPYYRNLKEKIYFGTDDEISRAYWAAHNYLVVQIQHNQKTLTKSAVIKEAHKAIDSSLKSMNPVNFSKEVKGRKFGVSQRKNFLNWIKINLGQRDYDMAIRLEKKYKKDLIRAKRAMRNQKIRNEISNGRSF